MARQTIALLLLFQIGCASITGSSHELLQVHAGVPQATVRVNGHERGSAPVSIEVPKHGSTVVEVSAPGYRSALCSTRMSAGGGYIAADIALCFFLFPIGCISFIDAGGAWDRLEAPQCDADLSPLQAAQP